MVGSIPWWTVPPMDSGLWICLTQHIRGPIRGNRGQIQKQIVIRLRQGQSFKQNVFSLARGSGYSWDPLGPFWNNFGPKVRMSTICSHNSKSTCFVDVEPHLLGPGRDDGRKSLNTKKLCSKQMCKRNSNLHETGCSRSILDQQRFGHKIGKVE